MLEVADPEPIRRRRAAESGSYAWRDEARSRPPPTPLAIARAHVSTEATVPDPPKAFLGIRNKFHQKNPRRDDPHGPELTERQQILVPSDDCIRGESRRNDVSSFGSRQAGPISGGTP